MNSPRVRAASYIVPDMQGYRSKRFVEKYGDGVPVTNGARTVECGPPVALSFRCSQALTLGIVAPSQVPMQWTQLVTRPRKGLGAHEPCLDRN